MIRIVTPEYYDPHAPEVRQMHAQRKAMYHDQLRWNVGVQDGFETDEYDRRNPIYLISMDSQCVKVRGSIRLHASVGPGPLKQNFPELVWRSSHSYIWESSRLCYGYKADTRWLSPGQSSIVSELIDAQLYVGRLAGAEVVVCVVDLRMERQLNAIGKGGERVGGPKRRGSNFIIATAWKTDGPAAG